MGLLLAVSSIYVPGYIRKRNLGMLFKSTADAFQVAVPPVKGLSADDCLKEYAQFTRAQALESIRRGDALEIQSRLFENASKIGRQFREDLRLDTAEQVMRAAEIIYKLLKIELHGETRGDIVIDRCFFSNYYSSDVCRLISSLDEGLLAGLSGGGALSFSQRITEGKECCRAFLDMKGGAR
jgi:hypothetical protein